MNKTFPQIILYTSCTKLLSLVSAKLLKTMRSPHHKSSIVIWPMTISFISTNLFWKTLLIIFIILSWCNDNYLFCIKSIVDFIYIIWLDKSYHKSLLSFLSLKDRIWFLSNSYKRYFHAWINCHYQFSDSNSST